MLASFGPVGPLPGDGAGADSPAPERRADAPEGAESAAFAALVQALGQHFAAPRPNGKTAGAAPGDGGQALPALPPRAAARGKSLPPGGTLAPREASVRALLDGLARARSGGALGGGGALGSAALGGSAAPGAIATGLADDQAAALTAMLTARSGPAEGDLAARLLARSAPPAETGDAATQPFARPAMPAAAESAPPLPMPSPGGQRGGFDQALGDRVLWMARNGISHAEIRVRPEHLGPIEARLSMEGDRVQVQLSAPSAVTREVLEQALPRLRGMFEEAGLHLGDAGVGEGGDGEATAETDAERADEGGESGNGAPGGGEPGDDETAGDEPGRWHRAPSNDRHLLDVFA